MPKYLCLQRSLSGGEQESGKPSPAQMQAMYAKFNEWREKFQQNLIDMGGQWDVVAQLALELQARRLERAGNVRRLDPAKVGAR